MPRKPVTWPGAGINYGHQLGTYVQATVDADLAALSAAGYRYIRIAMPPFDSSASITKVRDTAARVIAAGLIPMYGVGASSGSAVNATRWASFLSALDTEAAWARDNNIPYFLLGNEEELHVDGTTQTWANAYLDLKAKATAIKAAGYTGTIIYSSSQYNVNAGTLIWDSVSALGDIDLLGWNVYFQTAAGMTTHLAARVATFGTRTILTEWNTQNAFTGTPANSNEKNWQLALEQQWRAVTTCGMPIAAYFTYQDGSFGLSTDQWALKLSTGPYRWAWDALKN